MLKKSLRKGMSIVLVLVMTLFASLANITFAAEDGGLITGNELDELENLARGGNRNYSASSYYQSPLLPPDKAFDGDTTGAGINRWASADDDITDPWIQVSFGESVTFNKIRVYETPSEKRITSIKVLISNTGTDGSWNDIKTFPFNQTKDDALKDLDLVLPVTAKFLRLVFTGNRYGINIDEIEIYKIPVEDLYLVTADNGIIQILFNQDPGEVSAADFEIKMEYAGREYQELPVYNFNYDEDLNTASFKFNPIAAQIGAINVVISVSFNGLPVREASFTVAGLENLARGVGRSYSASSYYTGGPVLTPDKAFSGNPTGTNFDRWASGDGSPQWIQVSFGEAVTFNMVKVYETQGMKRVSTLKIQTSEDGDSWTDVKEFTYSKNDNDLKNCELPLVNTKFVRFLFGGATNGINVDEIEIYNVPFLSGFKVIEDFEGYSDGQTVPGSEFTVSQNRIVETDAALSGGKSLKLFNNSNSGSGGANGLDVYINKLIGAYNILVQIKSTSGGILGISAVDGYQFTKTNAAGYDKALKQFVEIQWNDVSKGFEIPENFDGYIFFINTENYYLENIRLAMIRDTFPADVDNILWIDNITASTGDNFIKILLPFENIKIALAPTDIMNSSISLSWDALADATGYNLYMNSTKINAEPISGMTYLVTGLKPMTYYTFSVAAIVQGEEIATSDNIYVATINNVADNELLSSIGKNLNLPFSDLALNMEYIGPALSDKDWYYWCVDPIDGDDGKTHLFAVRWPAVKGMGGWLSDGEIVHVVGDSAEGPFTVRETVLNNSNLPAGQRSPHNVRIKKIDDKYCLIYIVQTASNQTGQKICMAVADSLNGPWELGGDAADGIVVQADNTGSGWTVGSGLGTDNPDILKIGDKYYIYFKAGAVGAAKYGYAVSNMLESGYVKCDAPITNNISYIEDATAFEMNGKYYLLTTDNFGNNTGVLGYGILWESNDGTSFDLADAKIGFGLLSDYTAIPPYSAYPYGDTNKFERPAILLRNGLPAYFYGTNGTNVNGINATQNFVLKITLDSPDKLISPTASLASGSYEGTRSVTISAADGAKIYYTTNGADPTEASLLYTSPISLAVGTTTLKAIAVNEGYLNSDVASWSYTIVVTPADKEHLNALLASIASLNETDYTAKSWEVLQTALQTAQTVAADEHVTQEIVDGAVLDLSTAIDALEKITVESVVIICSALSNLQIGTSVILTTSVQPGSVKNPVITWSSSNEAVATVDETGKVTGIKTGMIRIIATCGDKSSTVVIRVMP